MRPTHDVRTFPWLHAIAEPFDEFEAPRYLCPACEGPLVPFDPKAPLALACPNLGCPFLGTVPTRPAA